MSTMIHHGDCREVMATMDASSVDAVVTDPPYGLSFMGKGWDHSVPGVEFWQHAIRVMKPGAYLLAFGGTRTFHRMAVAIEDAGFEIHDTISWLYGSGFPKHKSKLKPAWEPIIVARKPAKTATLLNVDACRIGTGEDRSSGGLSLDGTWCGDTLGYVAGTRQQRPTGGRWPANVVLDEEAAAALDQQSGERGGGFGVRGGKRRIQDDYGLKATGETVGYGDTGGASRFFFTADRDHICLTCNGTFTPKNGIMIAMQEDIPCDHVNTAELNSSHAETVNGSAVDPVPGRLPLDYAGSNQSNNGHASTAESSSTNTKPTRTRIAESDAWDSLTEKLVPRVRSAESLCERCTTAIAQSLAATLHGQTPASRLGLDSMPAFNASILTRNLAAFAEPMANTGIIPTTPSLSILFGSVRHAINEHTASSEPAPTRFLYQSKASRSERNAGLEGMPERVGGGMVATAHGQLKDLRLGDDYERPIPKSANHHPTVKPISLMRWLVRLVTPPGGIVLDPFAGSGTTGCAAALEGFDFIGIEREAEYVAIAERRIAHWARQPALIGVAANG